MTDLRALQTGEDVPTEPWIPGHHQCVTQIEPRLISGYRFVQRTLSMSIPRTGVGGPLGVPTVQGVEDGHIGAPIKPPMSSARMEHGLAAR